MSDRKYDFIFMDAGYTLFAASPSPPKFYHQVCLRHGCDTTIEQVIAAMRDVWVDRVIPEMNDPNADFSCSDEEDRAWWWNYDSEVFTRLGIPREKHAGIFDDIYVFFGNPSAWELYPDTVESLRQLKASDFSLAIVSNWNSSLKGIVDGLNLNGYFDFVIASAEAGAKKPSSRIFEIALQHAGKSPSRVVHIGDTFQTDILGARKAGIRGIMLDRRGGAHHEHEVIRSLLELRPLLVAD